MKRLLTLFLAVLLVSSICCAAYAEDYAAMIMDPKVKEIVINDEFHLTHFLTVPTGKKIIIAEEGSLVLDGREYEDDGMFLCLLLPAYTTLEVYGNLTTINNFYPGFVVANVTVTGGNVIIHESASTNDYATVCRYSDDGSKVEIPESGIPEGYELTWRHEEGSGDIDKLNEMLAAPNINRVTVACDLVVQDGQKLTVPSGQYLDIEKSVTVLPGGELDISPESHSVLGYRTVEDAGCIKLLPKG